MKLFTSLIIMAILLLSSNAVAMSFNTKIADYERKYVIEDKEVLADVEQNIISEPDFDFQPYLERANSNTQSKAFLKYLGENNLVICADNRMEAKLSAPRFKNCYFMTVNIATGKIVAIVGITNHDSSNVVNYKGTINSMIKNIENINSLSSALELIKNADCSNDLKAKAVEAAIKASKRIEIEVALKD